MITQRAGYSEGLSWARCLDCLLDFHFCHPWPWSGYFCSLGGHLSMSEKRLYSGNKLIHKTGILSCIQLHLSKALNLIHVSTMMSKMNFRRGKREIPTRAVGHPGCSAYSLGIVFRHQPLPSLTSPLRFGQALALRGTSLSAQPVSVYWRGRHPCERGSVYCSPSRFNGSGAVEASGNWCKVWIHGPHCPPKGENWSQNQNCWHAICDCANLNTFHIETPNSLPMKATNLNKKD